MTLTQTNNYDAYEREYWMAVYELSTGSPLPNNTPFSQVKKSGMIADVGLSISSDAKPEEVERLWLESVLAGAAQSQRIPDLWLQWAASQGIVIVGKTWRQAKQEWYLAQGL